MAISNELLDSLLADYQTPEDLIGEGRAPSKSPDINAVA